MEFRSNRERFMTDWMGGSYSIERPLWDPHKAADEFISADETTREAMRASFQKLLEARIAREAEETRHAQAEFQAARQSPSSYAKRRDIDMPIDVERIRRLVRSGNSVRHIEKLTGIGRNRINRICANGFKLETRERFRHNTGQHRGARGRYERTRPQAQ